MRGPGEGGPLAIEGKRVGRRGWTLAGMLALFGSLAATGVLVAVLGARAEGFVPFTVLGGMVAWWTCFLIASTPRAARIVLEPGGRLRVPWRKQPIVVGEAPLTLGRWVGAFDTPVGIVAYVGRGRLALGGHEHTGNGFDLSGRAARRVDFMLAGADLERLLGALGVHAERPPPDLVVDLLASGVGWRGALRTMAPWLVTMLVIAVVVGVLAATGLSERLVADPAGRVGLAAASIVLVVGGLGWQVARALRIRKAGCALRVGARELALLDAAGAPVVTAPWQRVRAVPFNHRFRVRGSEWLMPGYELTLGDHPPLRVGAWDPAQAWPEPVPRTRHGARWLAGAPQWRALVDAVDAQPQMRARAAESQASSRASQVARVASSSTKLGSG